MTAAPLILLKAVPAGAFATGISEDELATRFSEEQLHGLRKGHMVNRIERGVLVTYRLAAA